MAAHPIGRAGGRTGYASGWGLGVKLSERGLWIARHCQFQSKPAHFRQPEIAHIYTYVIRGKKPQGTLTFPCHFGAAAMSSSPEATPHVSKPLSDVNSVAACSRRAWVNCRGGIAPSRLTARRSILPATNSTGCDHGR